MDNAVSLLVLAGVLIWWYRPLRDFLVQRTNRTVKVLLVVMPLLFLGRAGYAIYGGQMDTVGTSIVVVAALLVVWLALVWLGNTLEKRRPTEAKAPDLATLAKIPGMPIPRSVVTAASDPNVQRAIRMAANPEVQQAARAAANAAGRAATEAAARVDWNDVAGSAGRISGRWAARLRKSMASNGSGSAAGSTAGNTASGAPKGAAPPRA